MHFYSLGFSDLLLYDFSHTFTLDENSLKFDYGHSVFYHFEEGFPLLFKAFRQHFSTAQLKVISIHNLDSQEVGYSDLANLIISSRLSLTELEIENTELKDAESVIDIHLPNIEKIKVPFWQRTNFHLILGEKLLWIEGYHDDLSFEFEKTLPSYEPEEVDEKVKLLRFMKNYPKLQGFKDNSDSFLYGGNVLQEFKLLKHLKYLYLYRVDPIQEYIGSENIEHLFLNHTFVDEIDWNYVASVKKLRVLSFRSIYNPPGEFFEYLRSDHLESLTLRLRYFEKNDKILFFEAISQTKKLKSVRLSVDAIVKNPVLSDSIESLEFEIKEFPDESEAGQTGREMEETGSESESSSENGKGLPEESEAEEYIPEQFPNQILPYLPFGKGVKHLVLNPSSGFANNIHQKDLDEHFPNLETIQFKCLIFIPCV